MSDKPALPQQEEPAIKKCTRCTHSKDEHNGGISNYCLGCECQQFCSPTPLLGQEEPVLPAQAKTPTFGRPTVLEILEEWADGRAYGENSHFIREFSKVAYAELTQALTSLAATEGDRLVCIDKNRQLVENCRKLEKLVDDACDAGEAVQAKLELAESKMTELESSLTLC